MEEDPVCIEMQKLATISKLEQDLIEREFDVAKFRQRLRFNESQKHDQAAVASKASANEPGDGAISAIMSI